MEPHDMHAGVISRRQAARIAKSLNIDSGPSELICPSKPILRTIRRLFASSCCYDKPRFENREQIDAAISMRDFERVIEPLIAHTRIRAGEQLWYLC